MANVEYLLSGHARHDIAQIRRYTIKQWGIAQWQKYQSALKKKLQSIANNPGVGMVVEEVSPNAYRYPLKDHVVYYLIKEDCVVFVGVLPNKFAPAKHLDRVKDLSEVLGSNK